MSTNSYLLKRLSQNNLGQPFLITLNKLLELIFHNLNRLEIHGVTVGL